MDETTVPETAKSGQPDVVDDPVVSGDKHSLGGNRTFHPLVVHKDDSCPNCDGIHVVRVDLKPIGTYFMCASCDTRTSEYGMASTAFYAWRDKNVVPMRYKDTKEFVTKDSGERQKFETGAQRDVQAGKGRYDLFPWLVWPEAEERWERSVGGRFPLMLCKTVQSYVVSKKIEYLWTMATYTMLLVSKDLYEIRRRLAGVLERGATKYGDRNWEKGIPIGRYLDSFIRHTWQANEGRDKDEDHRTQALWNILCLIQTLGMIEMGLLPESLQDIPDYADRKQRDQGSIGVPMPFLGFEQDPEALKGAR